MVMQYPAPANENDAKDDIVRAAAELFMNYGYSATSIDAIAEKLGATKGRIYHYYRSKSQIFFDIQRAAMTRLFEEVDPIARARLQPAEKLPLMAKAHLSLLIRDMPIQKVAVQGLEKYLFEAEGFRHAKTLAEINQLRDDYEQLFAEVIDAGTREGVFVKGSPRILTKPFFGAMNWATVWYRPRRTQSEDDIEMICSSLVDFAMRGLLVDKGGLHEAGG
ncbi:TetR/AcrR family transcriptional regulator [Anianabacter salinae]|uniref:TetR/AcrR family transcriptional regulator n=1 Tax=Anianabacter salinae TaxID=2851023 RepID=UPI00225E091D|nr:TetR/AcrR family transcriptional regulator [Anianabacter salinae]MBV0911855.1 TetR/AcrR family transcriptional regulator [Anianabacter salinae]